MVSEGRVTGSTACNAERASLGADPSLRAELRGAIKMEEEEGVRPDM